MDSSETHHPYAHGSNVDAESEANFLTQEDVYKQIRTYITVLNEKLEDLTRLIQEMSIFHQQNTSPRASTSVNSSAASPSPDVVTGGKGTSPNNLLYDSILNIYRGTVKNNVNKSNSCLRSGSEKKSMLVLCRVSKYLLWIYGLPWCIQSWCKLMRLSVDKSQV